MAKAFYGLLWAERYRDSVAETQQQRKQHEAALKEAEESERPRIIAGVRGTAALLQVDAEGPDTLTLTWEPSDLPGVTGYRVLRNGTQVGTTAGTTAGTADQRPTQQSLRFSRSAGFFHWRRELRRVSGTLTSACRP